MQLTDSILVLLATSKGLMQPQELNAILKVDAAKLSKLLKELVKAELVTKTPNVRYTLSESGEKKVTQDFPSTSIHPYVYKRIERYKKLSGKKRPDIAALPAKDNEVSEMMGELLTEPDSDDLAQIEIELANIEMTPLKAIEVKVKILHTLSNKFGGKVGEHLTELQHFISR